MAPATPREAISPLVASSSLEKRPYLKIARPEAGCELGVADGIAWQGRLAVRVRVKCGLLPFAQRNNAKGYAPRWLHGEDESGIIDSFPDKNLSSTLEDTIMLTMIIAFLVGGGVSAAMILGTDINLVWSIVAGFVALLVVQFGVGFALRKRITGLTNGIQAFLTDGQMRLQRKVKVLQQKPQGSIKQMQKMLEKDQGVLLEQAMDMTKALEPFFPWSFMLKQQITTMRMQFHFQLKNYDKVDELLPGCIFMEPMTVAMKMARMIKNEDPELDKFFKKKIKRFKGDKGTILYAAYTWALVKQNRIDEAHTVSTQAKEDTENDVLIKNWEHLANGRVKHFSNAGLGDEWYALGLEDPKVTVKRQRVGGKRRF